MMLNETPWMLIARKLAGEASQDDVTELERLRRENPHINYYIDILSAWWQLAEREGKDGAAKAVERLLNKLDHSQQKDKSITSIFGVNQKADWKKVGSSQPLPPSYGKQNSSNHFPKRTSMRKNYFKIAWHNLFKRRSYALINVVGLALGICACIVIFLITDYKLGFNKFHPDRNRVYRIVGSEQNSIGEAEFLSTPGSDVAALKKNLRTEQ